MEKSNKDQSLVDVVFQLPSRERIETTLDELDVLYSVRNNFFPAIKEVADQQTTGTDLIEHLGTAVYGYARTRPQPLADETVKRMLKQLPMYLEILVPRGEVLEGTLELLDGMMWPTLSELNDGRAHHEPKSDDPLSLSVEDAPANIRKLLKIPPNRRSDVAKERLNEYYPGLGDLALRHILGPRCRRVAQPSQRDLAQKTAEMQRQRE